MDKRIQFLFKIIFCLFISISGYSQCTDSVEVFIDHRGCKRISITEDLFVDLYVAKKDLDSIATEIDILKVLSDSLGEKNSNVEQDYKNELLISSQENDTLKVSLNNSKTLIDQVNNDNINLRIDNKKLKKRQIKLVGIGAIGVLVLEIAVKTFVLK